MHGPPSNISVKDNFNFNFDFDDIINYDMNVKENKQSYHNDISMQRLVTAHTILEEKIFYENKVRSNDLYFIHNTKWLPVKEHILTNKLNNLFVFAEDKPYMKDNEEKHCYQYYALDYNTVYQLSYQKKFHLFECFEGDEHIKLFMDIDIKNPDNLNSLKEKQDYLNQIIDSSIKLVLDKINEIHKYKIDDAKILIMKSDSFTKLSAHIIFQNIIFENVYHIRHLFSLLDSELIINKILDDSIYRRGTFRLLWNSKANKNINLEMSRTINYNFVDDKTLFMDCLLKNLPEEYHLIKLNIPNIDKPIIKKIPKNNKLNNNLDEIIYSPNYLKRYIDILNNDRLEHYKNWLQIISCIINCNPTMEGFKLFHDWSKNGLSYVSENDCVYYWNLMQKYNYKSTIGTLKYLAKKDNPELYSEIESSMDLPAYDSIKFTSEYLLKQNKKINEQLDNIVCQKINEWITSNDIKTLAIHSPMNTGKTRLNEQICNEFGFKRILMVSYRQSLTNDLYGSFSKLGFKSYIDGFYNANRIICQIESLHKLNQTIFDGYYLDDIAEYDLIIIDEIESILNHFRSTTIKDKEDTFNLFRDIIYNSKKLLVLDGDFNNRSFDFISFFGKSIILENQIQKNKKHFIYTNNRHKFDVQIDNDLKEGKNIVICSMSSRLATHYYNKYCKLYKSILHCGKSDDKLKNELKNVGTFWSQKRLIIYSPSIEAGVNFDIEHINKIYVILSNKSTSQRGLIQMMGRIRKLEDNNILIYMNNLPFKKHTSFYKYDEIKQCMLETNKYFSKTVLDPITNKMVRLKDFDLFNKILCYNLCEESNKSSNIFISYLNHLFDKKGFSYEFDENINKLNGLIKENILKDDILKANDINTIMFDLLLKKQSNNNATMDDKILIERYMFLHLWGKKEVTEDNNQLIDKYYGMSQILINLKDLVNGINNNDKLDYDTECKINKNKIINEVLNGLGYENVTDNKLIKRDLFEENMKKVMSENELFTNTIKSHPLFGLSKKLPQIKTVKGFLGFINILFADYGFCIRNKQKSINVNKKIEKKMYYLIEYINNINNFV